MAKYRIDVVDFSVACTKNGRELSTVQMTGNI